MKKIILLAATALLVTSFARSQDYKVVFDMTSNDTVNQQSLVRQLKMISEANAADQLEVVLYGQALNMVTKGSSLQSAVTGLAANKNISFKVCGAAMKRQNLEPSQLLPGVQVVPDGIYEIIMKQQQGWGYIKVAR
jgi:intracellular sulfur oxidation DsrE/DsrF family protein